MRLMKIRFVNQVPLTIKFTCLQWKIKSFNEGSEGSIKEDLNNGKFNSMVIKILSL